MGRLQDKVAIVTGGSSGIGRETTLLFAKEGANVFALDINEEKLNELKKEKKPLFKNRKKTIPRTKSITRTLEILNMYLNAVQLFKARTYLQYDFHKDKTVGNPMSLAKRNRRIIWIKSVISNHWNEINQKFTKKEHEAIFKFWANNFEIERFRIT